MSEFLDFLQDCFGRRGYIERKVRKFNKKLDKLVSALSRDLERIEPSLRLREMEDLKEELFQDIERLFK